MIGTLIGAAMIAAIAFIPTAIGMRTLFPRLRDGLILPYAAVASLICGALVVIDIAPRAPNDPAPAVAHMQAERAALLAENASALLECQALSFRIQDSAARASALAYCADAALARERVMRDMTATLPRSIEDAMQQQAIAVTPAPAPQPSH